MEFKQDNDSITEFWKWFYQNHELVKEVFEAEETHPAKHLIVNALDNHILEFGKFKWEIGYGQNKDYALTISPNGDEKLLEISSKIMEAAPSLPDWEFHKTKVPKEWDMKFQIYDEQMFIHEIDASSWRLVKMNQGKGKIAIILEAPNIIHLAEGVQKNAGNLVLTNMIGEENMILKVAGFLVIEKLNTQHQKNCHPLKDIRSII